MASNSVLLKGWALSLSAIVVALIPKFDATNSTQPFSIAWVTGLSIIIIAVFSVLDAYYLQQERKFRNEYNRKVRSIDNEDVKNALTIMSLKDCDDTFKSSYFSISIVPYYFSMVVSLLLGAYFI
ncbi:hypothetical protein [Plesiomonas shigelloides]|uniref:hypothetical protein n=1 Tax=Plesiomonas shigelloides TaxID=703 RepID=UPI001261B872|nr:hypothetical protein [Plesiomonas shigelloides]KAB7670872.1 hypothetical protein GBN25_01015 [Plesiomonas shigelloides]